MIKIKLTKEELVLLKDYQNSRIELIRNKALAIVMKSRRLSCEEISQILFKTRRTIEIWVSDFSRRRFSSLFSGHEGNENAGKLTREQKLEIAEALKQPVTEDSLIPKRFWDVPELRKYVSARFNVVYESKQSYHFLLKFSDLSFKYPDKQDIHRNEELIEKRMGEIKSQLPEFKDNNEWEVFCSDETRLEARSITRRAWIKKNEKTVIKISRDHEAQSYIGFLNQKDFKCNLFEIAAGNQKEMIRTIQLLKKQYPKKKLCIIWDNAKFHKGKEIKAELRVGGKLENVYFINLPPYAPEHNPIEHVWNTAKSEIFKLRISDGFEELKRKFKSFITASKFNYEILKNEVLF